MEPIKIEKDKKFNWRTFFDMRIFCYSFLQQLKSIATWVYIIAIWLASIIFLKFAIISQSCIQFNSSVKIYKAFLLFAIIISFIFIGVKSLQIFREEMDDGILLILSSMTYTRLRLIMQKWLSIMAVWSIIAFVIFILNSVTVLGCSSYINFNYKLLIAMSKFIFRWFFVSILIMTLVSSIIILISVNFVAITGLLFTILFMFLYLILLLVPTIIKSNELETEEQVIVNKLGQIARNQTLSANLVDPKLKQFYEIENWIKKDKNSLEQLDTNTKYSFRFADDIIKNIHEIVTGNKKNITDFAWTKKLSIVGVEFSSEVEGIKNFSTISSLLNKYLLNSKINLCSLSTQMVKNRNEADFFTFCGKHKLNKSDPNYNLIKSFNDYKNAFDNLRDLTDNEKEIINLSKSYFNRFELEEINTDKFIIKRLQRYGSTIIENLWDQYCKKYGNSVSKSTFKDEMRSLFPGNSKTEINFYFVDNIALNHLTFLMDWLQKDLKRIYCEVSGSYKFWDCAQRVISPEERVKHIKSYYSKIKINNFLNIAVQWFILLGGDVICGGFDTITNKTCEWEVKPIKLIKEIKLINSKTDEGFELINPHSNEKIKLINQDNGKEIKLINPNSYKEKTIKVLKFKPETFGQNVHEAVIFILYLLLAGSLIGTASFIIYRKEIT